MTLICETIHEHMKILPKYILKMPLRANTNTNKHNGTQPNKKIKKKKKNHKLWQENEILPTPFKNNPNPRNPRI